MQVTDTDRTYEFVTDDSGRLVKVIAIAHIERPALFASRWGFANNVVRFEMHRDNELYGQVIAELQALESFAAFHLNVKSFNWMFAEYEVIPENDDEARLAGIFKGPQFYPFQPQDQPARASAHDIETVVVHAGRFPELTTLASYWREGMNDMRASRYINAFVQFYFILEGEFADGEHRSAQVRAKFRASRRFVGIIEKVINSLPTEASIYHELLLKLLRRTRSRKITVDSVLLLLTDARRQCHHFRTGDENKFATPLRHLDYEPIAYLALRLATGTIRSKGMALNAQKWQTAREQDTNTETPAEPSTGDQVTPIVEELSPGVDEQTSGERQKLPRPEE